MSGIGWLRDEGRREEGGGWGALSFRSSPLAPSCVHHPSSRWLAELPVFTPIGVGAGCHTCPPAVFNDPAHLLLIGALASRRPPVLLCAAVRAVCLTGRFKCLTKAPRG